MTNKTNIKSQRKNIISEYTIHMESYAREKRVRKKSQDQQCLDH